MPDVTGEDKSKRGRAIRARRERHGITSLRMFEEVSGVNRASITKAEAGIASIPVIVRLEQVLDTLDRERGVDTTQADALVDPAPTPLTELASELGEDVIEVEVTGPSTMRNWHVVFRAHPEHVDLITEQAAKLLRDIDAAPESRDS